MWLNKPLLHPCEPGAGETEVMLILLSSALVLRLSYCSHDLPVSSRRALSFREGGTGLCSLFPFVTFLQQTKLLKPMNVKNNLIVLFSHLDLAVY